MNPDKLFDYLDDRLPAAERAALEERLMLDKQLQRELAVARQIHAGMRGDSREVLLAARPDVTEQGRKMALHLLEAPSYGLAPSHRAVLPTGLRENRRAFPHESVGPPPARVAIACPTSVAPPARRALLRAACRKDNQNACMGSLFRNVERVLP